MTSGPDGLPLGFSETAQVEISDAAVMSRRPVVSVQMITYNHKPYISQAIEGVLAQKTDFPVELVIGEDCSTDGTREVVLEYQRRHPEAVRVITSARNVGMTENARRAAGACRGKYLALCEGDDRWIHPRKLQMQVDIMEADPGVGLVHGGAVRCDVASGRCHPWKRRPRGYDDGDVFIKLITGRYFIYTATACMRMDLFRAARERNPEVFDGRYLMGDIQLWLELSRVTRFRLVNEPLAAHNILPESATRSADVQKEIRFWKSVFEVRMHYVRRYNAGGSTERHVRTTHARRFLRYAYVAGDRGLADEAWRALKDLHVPIRPGDLAYYTGARNGSVRTAIRALRRLRLSLR